MVRGWFNVIMIVMMFIIINRFKIIVFILNILLLDYWYYNRGNCIWILMWLFEEKFIYWS